MTILTGDCLTLMPTLDADSVDAIVTDPPYGLGFMGKDWDHGVPGAHFWQEALRVAKPGAHMVVFGGTRTHHRLMVAIEDAGWEIRDCLMWLYGSGFPKSLNVQQAINKAARGFPQGGADPTSPNHGKFKGGCTEESPTGRGFGAGAGAYMEEQGTARGDDAGPWQGWGTALKPAWEPIVLARKPLAGVGTNVRPLTVAQNVQTHGTGALNIDGCRIEYQSAADKASATPQGACTAKSGALAGGTQHDGARSAFDRPEQNGRWPANLLLDVEVESVMALDGNVPSEVRAVIEAYFHGYCAVPPVWTRDADVSQSADAHEVLQPGVLCRMAVGPSTGGRTSDAWAVAHAGGARAHSTESSGADGTSQPAVAGTVPLQGVRDDQSAGQAGAPGTSDGHGGDAGTAAPAVRSGPSQERREVGQPAGESGTAQRRDAQARASGRRAGTSGAAQNERGLVVLACDVPAGWASYFVRVGEAVLGGSAALLDAQTGVQKSGVAVQRHGGGQRIGTGRAYQGSKPGRVAEDVGFGDIGGASRFFYCAKASKSERDSGCETLPMASAGEMTGGRKEGSDGLKSPRAGAGRTNGARNSHPTVKPLALMRWLVRLITPPGGLVLDPFMGSGSTGLAAMAEGARFTGIELEPAYVQIAEARLGMVPAAPEPEPVVPEPEPEPEIVEAAPEPEPEPEPEDPDAWLDEFLQREAAS